MGILENATGQTQEFPDVMVVFRDETGQEVASDFGYVELETVPVGGRAPFHLITFVQAYATYDLSVEATPVEGSLRTDLTLSNVQMSEEGDLYVVTGDITNAGASLEIYAQIAVALLDEAGRAVGVGAEWLEGEDLGGGQTVSFRIEVFGFLNTAVDFDIIAVGL